MNLTVIGVGTVKEKYLRDACAEYEKRLSAYCRPSVIEVKDEKTPDGCSEHVEEQIRVREGKRILERIRDRSFVVALDIRGKKYDSPGLSAAHADWEVRARGDLVFVIGGSLGLSEEVLRRADQRISFSDLTFPHQLMRVILLEQLYRSYRIRNHEPYHK